MRFGLDSAASLDKEVIHIFLDHLEGEGLILAEIVEADEIVIFEVSSVASSSHSRQIGWSTFSAMNWPGYHSSRCFCSSKAVMNSPQGLLFNNDDVGQRVRASEILTRIRDFFRRNGRKVLHRPSGRDYPARSSLRSG